MQKVKWEDWRVAIGWYYWLVLAALGTGSRVALFKGTNPLSISAVRAGRSGKGKDIALDSTLFFLMGSHGPHKLTLRPAKNKWS